MNILKIFGLILLACGAYWLLDQLPAPGGLANWLAYTANSGTVSISRHIPAPKPEPVSPHTAVASPSTSHCDGRRYCSQMTSCAEARYFLAHCPDTEMDGDNDGIPCEKQWCEPD